MLKLRLSNTVLDMWNSHNYDDALGILLHGIWPEPNDYMLLGQYFHKQWELESGRTSKLPEVFGATKLINPQIEKKVVIQLCEWAWLVGRLDVVSGSNMEIYDEYKFGKTPIATHVRKKQAAVMKVLQPQLKLARFHSLNPYENPRGVAKMFMVHMTDKMYNEGVDHIVSTACDIRATIENMRGVYE